MEGIFDVDNIRLDETEHLNLVINKLDSAIIKIKSKLYTGVHQYSIAIDNDDWYDIQYKKGYNSWYETILEDYNRTRKQVYFARMDFKLQFISNNFKNEEKSTIYIGKSMLELDNDILVYDWRSPVGQKYYLKNIVEFDFEKYHYILELRRALTVEGEKLVDYFDEYCKGIDYTSFNITDPFLLKVLKEKRNVPKLTDIIQTIQQKQINIINQDQKKSMIIQGCAGSGKTMILLHRLSYLLYNDPSLDTKNIKIITPNHNFSLFIDELSHSLGISSIQRITIEQYYRQILETKKIIYKLLKPQNEFESGKTDFLSFVYSLEFKIMCQQMYDETFKKFYNKYNVDTINDFFESLKEEGVNFNFVDDIKTIGRLSITRSKLNEKIDLVKSNNIRLEKMQQDQDFISKLMLLESYYQKYTQLLILKTNHEIEINKLNLLMEQRDKDKTIVSILRSLFSRSRETSNSYNALTKNLLDLNNEFSETLNKCNEIIDSINDIVHNLPYVIKGDKELSTRSQKYTLNDISQSFFNETYKNVLQNPDINNTSLKNEMNKLGSQINSLESQNKAVLEHRSIDDLESLSNMIGKLIEYYDNTDFFYEIVGRLYDAKHQSIYNKKFFGISRKLELRHILYLHLIYLKICLPSFITQDTMIYIDEAQEINLGELILLKDIASETTSFNLYGDLKQRFNPIGIASWDQVRFINLVYELNENYRNTIEVTNYINKSLNINMLPIGITGGLVYTISLESLLSCIIYEQELDNKSRIAILYTCEKIKNEINNIVNNIEVKKTENISILHLHNAKGLEFEIVYCITEEMTLSELYVAYTRALYKLYII